MKKLRTLFVTLLVLAMALAPVAMAEEDYTVTAWCACLWGGQDIQMDTLMDSYLSSYLYSKTGIRYSVEIPTGSEDETAAVMIASGSYPDMVIFNSKNNTYLNMMYEAGMLLPISDLIDEYAPDIWDYVKDYQLTLNTKEDGKLYYLSTFVYDPDWGTDALALGAPYVELPFGNNIMTVKTDIYEAFGKEITDLDSFTEYLYFVKENYPDQPIFHAPNNSSPRSGNLYAYMQGVFGMWHEDYYPVGDGTIKHYMNDPAYVDYLSWLNQLYKDGLFTQNDLVADDTTFNSIYYGEDSGYAAQKNALWNMFMSMEDVENCQYTLLDPFTNDPDREWNVEAMYTYDGNFNIAITNNCQDPQKVMEWLSCLFTNEMQLNMIVGPEEDNWYYDTEGNICFKEGALDRQVEINNERALYNPFMHCAAWEAYYNAVRSDGGEYTQLIGEWTDRYLNDYCVEYLSIGYQDIPSCITSGSDLDVLRTRVNDICTVAGEKMIVAADDAEFNQIYEDCLAEIEALGVAQIEEAYTAEHVAQCEALGIEP